MIQRLLPAFEKLNNLSRQSFENIRGYLTPLRQAVTFLVQTAFNTDSRLFHMNDLNIQNLIRQDMIG